MELKVDPARRRSGRSTGIFVRALHEDRHINADIAELDRESLLTWLKSRGGDNKWAEDCVLILLGHKVHSTSGG